MSGTFGKIIHCQNEKIQQLCQCKMIKQLVVVIIFDIINLFENYFY